MADLGLLAGLASGLQEGVKSYQTERRYQDEKAKEEAERQALKRRLAADLMSKGMRETPTGEYEFTADEKEKQSLERDRLKAQATKDRADAAKALRESKGLIGGKGAGLVDKAAPEYNPEKDPSLNLGTKLRGEYQSLPEVKAASTVDASYRIIKNAAKNPSAAGDLSLIFAYMKMLDPGSTVREGEFANAQNAAGVPDQIRNIFNRVQSGQRLNPQQRTDFVSSADGVYQSAMDRVKEARKRYGFLASQYGTRPDLVFGEEERAQEATPPTVGQKIKHGGKIYSVLPNGDLQEVTP